MSENSPLRQPDNSSTSQLITTTTDNNASSSTSPSNHATAVNSTLPDDFLRTASNNDQMSADAEFARQLVEADRMAAQNAQNTQNNRQTQNTQQNQQQQQQRQPPGPNDSVGTRTISRLNITVCEAKVLKSSTLLPGMIKMDPYARVRVGHSMYSTQTHVSGDLNPIWDRQIIATLPVGINEIFVELFDEKTFQEDKRIAFAVIQLPDEILTNRQTVTKWFKLSDSDREGQAGEVKLVMSLTEYRENILIRNGGIDPNDMSPAMANLPPPVQISNGDVQMIKEMFPQIDDDTIRSVLVQKGGDKEAAISTFLSMQ